jgi:hypothetical protein
MLKMQFTPSDFKSTDYIRYKYIPRRNIILLIRNSLYILSKAKGPFYLNRFNSRVKVSLLLLLLLLLHSSPSATP